MDTRLLRTFSHLPEPSFFLLLLTDFSEVQDIRSKDHTSTLLWHNLYWCRNNTVSMEEGLLMSIMPEYDRSCICGWWHRRPRPTSSPRTCWWCRGCRRPAPASPTAAEPRGLAPAPCPASSSLQRCPTYTRIYSCEHWLLISALPLFLHWMLTVTVTMWLSMSIVHMLQIKVLLCKYRVISGSCKIVGAKILIILKENMHFKLLYLIYTSNILF